MTNANDILAAKLNLACDYNAIAKEIFDCSKHWIYIPPYKDQIDDPFNEEFNVASVEDFESIDYIENRVTKKLITRQARGGHIFYIRKNIVTDSQSFADTKPLPHDTWKWRDDLDIPYTRKFIESLPFTTIGMIRVFIFKDTFLPVHKDYINGGKIANTEHNKCLGLSIIPTTGNVPMKIWSNNLNRVVEVPGNAILFNDSVWHAVPKTTGYRITMRVFGEIDYNCFLDKVDFNHAYYV